MNRSNSKEKILRRVRQALGGRTGDKRDGGDVDRSYRTQSQLTDRERVELFAERVGEYKAVVKIVNLKELPESIKESLKSHHVERLVIPPGLEERWLQAVQKSTRLYKDEPEPLTNQELDESEAVLTGCYLAAAQTGTIALNGGKGQGRRALTLIPDFHICVVFASQIRGIIPEVFAELDHIVKENGPPVTLISGPSATSDIELNRVEGVHGPRRLHVIVVWEF